MGCGVADVKESKTSVDVISQAPDASVSLTKISAHFDVGPGSIVAAHTNE
jgi:hypothetical protein